MFSAAINTVKTKFDLLMPWIRIQRHTATDFQDCMKMTRKIKAAYFSIFRIGFRKTPLQPYVELPREA